MECGKQIEGISFTHDEAVAGIWCLDWDPLIPKGCQETGEGSEQGYKDIEQQLHASCEVKLWEMCFFSLVQTKQNGHLNAQL